MAMSDDPQDFIRRLAKRHGFRPGNIVIAVNEPMRTGEMLPFAGRRYKVTRSLTREEFWREAQRNFENRENNAFGDHEHMGVQTTTRAGRTDAKGWRDAPAPDQRYFYALEEI